MESGILLGHGVIQNGLQVDSNKVQAILALLAPVNVTEVEGYLGCVGYYTRFIIYYAKQTTPLT